MKPIQVVLVEDDEMFLTRLSDILQREEGIEVVGQSSTPEEGINLVKKLKPDVVLMDIFFGYWNPAGIAVTREIHRAYKARVVMLTGHDQEEMIHRALDAGAIGYVLKIHTERIGDCVRTAYRDESPIGPRAARKLLKHWKNRLEAERIRSRLTKTEIEILRLLVVGEKKQKEIASDLYIREQSLRNHLYNIRSKLDFGNTKDLVKRVKEIKMF